VTYGGDSGNRIFVLYWRCPLISVSVIRGSTVLTYNYYPYHIYHNLLLIQLHMTCSLLSKFPVSTREHD
jgi:hypothetical protein